MSAPENHVADAAANQSAPRSSTSEPTVSCHTPVPMAPGYFVTRDGCVFSAIGWRGVSFREMAQDLNADGYPSVRVLIEGKRTRMATHRLLASAFLPPRPSPAHEIRHIDGDRLNRCAGNLTWGTRADNAADREAHGRTSRGAKHSAAIKAGLERRAS